MRMIIIIEIIIIILIIIKIKIIIKDTNNIHCKNQSFVKTSLESSKRQVQNVKCKAGSDLPRKRSRM